MMARVSIHAPKTPVTTGSKSIAASTVPNVCKMPGVPFTPVALPNIGRSGDSPKGYSQSVFINGETVAIEGCSFGSMGDIASKGTGGGILSSNTCGPTKFIGPGTFDVRIEGKGVHLLGDPTFNNCGPSGGPPNAATMAGVIHDPLLKQQGEDLGVQDELQEICNLLCECEAAGKRSENCLYKKLKDKEEERKFEGTTKSQVPYKMNPKGGGPPTPYMSKKEAWRATRNWFKRFSRRPDAVIVKNPALDPIGDNIKAVVEVKVGKMGWGKGQERDYRRIAGGRKKLVEVNDKNCKCSPPPPPVPVMAEKPARNTVPRLSPIAVCVGFAAALAAAAAVVAAAPFVATAAVAAGIVVLASGSPQGAGGTGDAI
jgi:hypothetical protein